MAKRIVVLDIGGTSIKSGLFSDGELHDIKETPTNAFHGGPYVIEKAKEIIRSYGENLDAIGISTAGQVDSQKGVILYANENIPNYTGMKIRELLNLEFQVPVAVENDVNSAALGEAHYGAARGYKDFLCITYGTGVGGAIILNQKIYTGSSHSAGEFGGIVTHPEAAEAGRPFQGCYEKYASTTVLVKMACQFDSSLTDGRLIFKRANEPEVKRIIDLWIDEIVNGLLSVIHIFNPSLIVLGGGIMKEPYVTEQVQKRAYSRMIESFRGVLVEPAALGNRAGLLGAAWLAEECLKNNCI